MVKRRTMANLKQGRASGLRRGRSIDHAMGKSVTAKLGRPFLRFEQDILHLTDVAGPRQDCRILEWLPNLMAL